MNLKLVEAGVEGDRDQAGMVEEQSHRAETALTPREIVAELDRYIISQEQAKRAVAVAMRNRWRRLHVPEEMRDEITPKNIIMIGPTGVGKTEISRRLAKLARAPFIKVEASKFTEVGYVGRDVESIIRDLVEISLQLVRAEERSKVLAKAQAVAEERLLDLLLPDSAPSDLKPVSQRVGVGDGAEVGEGRRSTRDKLLQLLRAGKLEERLVEIETTKQVQTHLEIVGPPGFGEVEGQLKEIFSNMIPRGKEKRRLPVSDARKILIQEAQEGLIDQEFVTREAVRRTEQSGIVFVDEVDKICASAGHSKGPDISREGVQRDLLPIVEGTTVNTRYGAIRTDHILFVASGAFHLVKPSDLMPEFQGRFPIRVELGSLSAEHFERILTEPENALTKQYVALLKTEGVELEFTSDAIRELSVLTAEVNSRTENIGARRLHTLLEKLLEDLSFRADSSAGERVVIDQKYVRNRLADVVKDVDLSRFIL